MKSREKINLAYFAKQSGAVVTTAIMVIGLGLTLWGMHSLRKKAEEIKAKQVDVSSEEVTGQEKSMDKIEPNKAELGNRANVVEMGVEGGKTVIGTAAPVHDSLVLTAYDKTVGFTVEQKQDKENNKEETARDNKVKEKLESSGLPSDKLSRDVAKRIEDVAMENSPAEAEGDVLKSVKEVVDKKTKQVLGKDKSKQDFKDSAGLKESIKEELNKKDVLEDQRIIDKKKQIELMTQEKETMEKVSDAYYEYADKGLIVSDKEKYDEFNRMIDKSEEKISSLSDELLQEQDSFSTLKIASGESGESEDIELGEEELQEENTEEIGVTGDGEDEDTSEEDSVEEGTEETGEEGEDTQQEEQSRGYVVLNGTIAGGKGTISMTINLDTGNISGDFSYRDIAGDCNVRVSANIYGTMDLDTRKIRTSVSGTSYYSGEEEHCDTTMAFTDSLNGTLSQDNSSASGTCSHGESWYVD